jgi:hypothetical protein
MPAENTQFSRLLEGSGAPQELECADEDALQRVMRSASEPVVLRGLVKDWPLVKAGLESPKKAGDYLTKFYGGKPLIASFGEASIRGRVGYNDDLSGFNFQRTNVELAQFLQRLYRHGEDQQPPASYIGSTLIDQYFPGMRAHNDLTMEGLEPLVSLWIGNQITVPAHFDFPANLACCVVGRRRFTLLPPEQLENLYVGPWDMTPAGQAISLVNFKDPDFERFPRFREAMSSALEVVLEPGDALFLPSMWWHHVEGLDSVNMLVNYWWRSTPQYMGTPMNVFKHALLGLRGLPEEQRKAWQNIFNYYVFNAQDEELQHIPEQSRGMHGPMSELQARKLRADLLNMLNR